MRGLLVFSSIILFLSGFNCAGLAQVQGAVNNNMSHYWAEMSGIRPSPPSTQPVNNPAVGSDSKDTEEDLPFLDHPSITEVNGYQTLVIEKIPISPFLYENITCLNCGNYYWPWNYYLIKKEGKYGILEIDKKDNWFSPSSAIENVWDTIIPCTKYHGIYYIVELKGKYGLYTTSYGNYLGVNIMDCKYDSITVVETEFLKEYYVKVTLTGSVHEFRLDATTDRLIQMMPTTK